MDEKVTTTLPAGIAVWPKLDQVDLYQPTDKKGRPSGAAKPRFITRVKYNDALPPMRRLSLDVPTVN